ncbi:MAG: hypothetical protein KY440_13475 [Actinobacteria bacterium]|nr:hypothetical protein [Actinomycetota bacterium]
MSGDIRTGVLALCLALPLAACGGGDERARTVEGAASPSSAASASAAPVEVEGDGDKTLTEAQLKMALLTVTDLPTGYRLGTVEEDDDSKTTGTGASDECSDKFKRLSDAEGTEAAKAEAAFEGGGFGTILEQSLESYEDEDVVQDRFDDVVEVLSECKTFSDTDKKGVKTDFTVGPLSFPKLGDDTVALAITGKSPDFTISLNVVIVRLGRNVMIVGQGGFATDVPALEQAVNKGFEKLAAATE